MVLTAPTLISLVRTAMRLPMGEREMFTDDDVFELDRLILSVMPQAARYVYERAPMSMLIDAAVDISEEGVYWHESVDGYYSGHVLLPRDFLRLAVFEMSDWRCPVTRAIDVDSPYYETQYSPYAGIRGTPYRPVCLLSESSDGHVLEFFSCLTDTASVVQAKYIPVPIPDEHGGIDLAPACVPQIINTAAEQCMVHSA